MEVQKENDDEYEPGLVALSNTRNSVTLSWRAPISKTKPVYKIQVRDRLWGWITKYWGFNTQVEIKELRPQESYCFRLGMKLDDQTQKSKIMWYSTINTTTKDEPIAAINLHTAILFEHVNLTKKFLSLRPAAIDCYDSNGKTPLMKCARLGNVNIASLLISAGASINMQSIPSRNTALMIACWFGHFQIASLLHENKGDWNIKDNHGCTALHYAVDNSNVDLINFAIECGAVVEEKDDNGWTPLLRGVYLKSDTSAISQLIKSGANVNMSDPRGQTPLMQAIITGYSNLPVIKLLISAGADIRAVVEELISSLEKSRDDSDNEGSDNCHEQDKNQPDAD